MIKNINLKIIRFGSTLILLLITFTLVACTTTANPPKPAVITPTPADEVTATPEPTQAPDIAAPPTITVEDSGKLNLSEGLYIIHIEKPIITVIENESTSSVINQAIEAVIETEINLLYQTAENNGLTETSKVKYGLYVSYNVFNLENGIVSIKLNSSSYTGQAHPFNRDISINYNATTASEMTLADVFVEGFDYATPINAIIKSTIEAQEKTSPVGYYRSYRHDMNGTENFYTTAEGINIVYATGDIAPYAVGEIVFTIPYSAVADGLNPIFN
jgi:hypothetical protein